MPSRIRNDNYIWKLDSKTSRGLGLTISYYVYGGKGEARHEFIKWDHSVELEHGTTREWDWKMVYTIGGIDNSMVVKMKKEE